MKQLLYYSGPHFLSYIVQKNSNGKTAYDHALNRGQEEAARMLKDLEQISMDELKRATLN